MSVLGKALWAFSTVLNLGFWKFYVLANHKENNTG